MVAGYQPAGTYRTRMTYTGYDNRVPNGLYGNLSLVRPGLPHTDLGSSGPNEPIDSNFSATRVW
jgi:hypothetical protein